MCLNDPALRPRERDVKTPGHWIAASLIAGFILAAGAAQSNGSAELQDPLGEEYYMQAELVTGGVCASVCHSWDLIFGGPRRTPSEWDTLTGDMVIKGAQASDEQMQQIRSYLKWSWGKVWINTASASDLVAVLALPASDATAVIAWRDANGRFADLESLKAVPGIDTATLDEQADAILFN